MLNIFKLNIERDTKEIRKYEVYREILNKIHNKIIAYSKKNQTEIVYVIPNILVGFPTFNQIKCAEYCVDKLRKNGFVIIYTYPNLIFVSWNHIPSKIKNPEVSFIEYQLKDDPYKDYSNLIKNLCKKPENLKIEY